MRIQSPLHHLCDTLAQVRDSATKYGATLQKNEAATRAVLIDPVLRALGWDMANTHMAEVEKSVKTAIVDYALFDSQHQVKVLVEAKSLGSNLSQQVLQIVTYAFTFGNADLFLTDGLVWQHFTEFHPNGVTPTRTLNLATDDLVDCAAYLVHRLDAAKFWRETQPIDVLALRLSQLETLVGSLQNEIATLKSTPPLILPTPKPAQPDSSMVTPPPNVTPYPLNGLPAVKGKKPHALRLPDGRILAIKSWKQLLLHVCQYALDRNSNIPIPFESGPYVDLLSWEKPKDRNVAFVSLEYQGKDIYLYANYSADNIVRHSLRLLDLVPKLENGTEAAIWFE